MDYEKKYNHALEVVRELQKDWASTQNRAAREIESAFPELRESEDERIRKWLVDYFSSIKETVWIHRDITCGQILSYLEKQKEPKPISSCDIVPYIDDKIAALQDMWREEKVAFDWDDMKDMIEDVARHFYQKEQKPAEWSEEDEMMRQGCIDSIKYELLDNGMDDEVETDPRIAWLKSLRPSWKPSEEQMSVLGRFLKFLHESGSTDFGLMDSLLGQLKKL